VVAAVRQLDRGAADAGAVQAALALARHAEALAGRRGDQAGRREVGRVELGDVGLQGLEAGGLAGLACGGVPLDAQRVEAEVAGGDIPAARAGEQVEDHSEPPISFSPVSRSASWAAWVSASSSLARSAARSTISPV
jgi:hypothetical protein